MDLSGVIEKHHEALKRIAAGLVAMVLFGVASLVSRACGVAPVHHDPALIASGRTIVVPIVAFVGLAPRPGSRPLPLEKSGLFQRVA